MLFFSNLLLTLEKVLCDIFSFSAVVHVTRGNDRFTVHLFRSKVREANHLVNSPGAIPSKRSRRAPRKKIRIASEKVNVFL